MSSEELTYWMAFDSISPFGAERDNYHAGVVASTVANCHSKKSFSPADFMLKDEAQKKQEGLQSFMKGLRAHAKQKK